MKNKKILYLIPVIVILVILLLVFLLKKDTNDATTNINSENIVSTETVEPTETIETEISETEVVVETESEKETEVIVIGEENPEDDIWYDGKPDVERYMSTHEFVGYNDSYKSVKGDPRYEIVDGCYKGVPLEGDSPSESWTYMIVWISPSGIEIKLNDAYAYLATKQDIVGMDDALWSEDPDKDLEPGSVWFEASKEFVYNEHGDTTDVERNRYGFIDLSTLPYVSTTTEKRDSFELTDEFKAYAEQWSIYNNYQMSGILEYNIINALLIYDDNAYPWMEGMYKTWEISREDGYWKVTFYRNPNELSWHGILTCIKTIHPSAQGIYDAIYNEFYNDTGLPENDKWVDFDNYSIKVYLENGYICFNFK